MSSEIRWKKALLGSVSALVVSMSAAAPVYAQDNESDDVQDEQSTDTSERKGAGVFSGEIVVTAQRREENAQDVGIAITAFTGEQLQAARFTNAADVLAQTPGAIARRHFPSRGLTTNMFVRGVGQTDFNDGTESSVAPFVDEFYLIQASTSDFATFDMERVEVLRGPQGTLFGRNATGGAIQSITNKPEEGFSGSVEVGYGNFEQVLIDGFLNIPLSDTVQLRLSGVAESHGPYVENIFPGQPDILDQNFAATRAQLRWAPSDTFENILKYEFGNTEGRLLGDQAIIFAGTADGDIIEIAENGAGFNPVLEGVDGPNITSEDNLNDALNRVHHVLNTFKWDLGFATLTSISGFLDQRFELFEDCDSSPNPTCAFSPDVDSQHWSQEFRLNGDTDRLNWTLGLYYLGQNAKNDLVLPIFLTPGVGGALPSASIVDIDWDLNVRSFAAFGQIEYELTDTLTFIGGLRINNDRKKFEQIRDFVTVDLPAGTTAFNTPELHRFFEGETSRTSQHIFTEEVAGDLTVQNDTNWSGTLQLNYEPNQDLLLYGSVRRGLKAAGFNNGLVDVRQEDIDLLPYKQEVLYAYEAGWKWDFGTDFTGRINGAVFYYDYNDFQATQYVGIGNLISNNEVEITGAELEVQLVPTDGLFASFTAGYLDTVIRDVPRVSFTDPNVTFVADRELAEAPEFSGSALLRYDWFALNGDWGAQVDATYTGARWVDVLNQSALRLESFVNVNANLSYTHEETGISARIWVRNLTQERVPLFLLAAPGLDNLGQVNWNEPRTYGATLRYEF